MSLAVLEKLQKRFDLKDEVFPLGSFHILPNAGICVCSHKWSKSLYNPIVFIEEECMKRGEGGVFKSSHIPGDEVIRALGSAGWDVESTLRSTWQMGSIAS